MKTTFCYSGISWRVFQHNRFVGYVVAMSEYDALRKAQEKYGDYILVERISCPS
jgi:hypothetical protein